MTIFIFVYIMNISYYMYTYVKPVRNRDETHNSVSSVPGVAFLIVGQDREVKSKWVWWPLLPEEPKTRVGQWWGGWNWYYSLRKQKASAVCLGVLIMSFAIDWAILYLPQVMFCKVLLRKKVPLLSGSGRGSQNTRYKKSDFIWILYFLRIQKKDMI